MTEEKTTQGESDLFPDTYDSEVDPEDASTTDLDSEESKESLFDEEVTEADRQREKQIRVWQQRLNAGEVELSDIPHKWIRDAMVVTPKVDKDTLQEAVAKALAEEKAKERFMAMRNELVKANLSKVKQQAISQEFEDLRQYMSDDKALEKAMRVVGVDSSESQRLKALRESAALPMAGYTKAENGPEEDIMSKPEKDRLAEYENIRTRQNFKA